MKPKLYVGCGLTWALPFPEPKEFVQFREEVKSLVKLLKEGGEYELLEFVGLSGGRTPEECGQVYHYDIHRCVAEANYFLAICDWPSLGLGYELGMAVEKRGVPTLATAHHRVNVTRLVLGIDHPNYRFRPYDNLLQDAPRFLREMRAG